MVVRKLRLRKGWSQDQLAEMAAVSVRTIQRIERGRKPSLETANALAAVFGVDVTTFTTEHTEMVEIEHKAPPKSTEHIAPDEAEALEYAKEVKDFLSGLGVYVILAVVFFAIEGFGNPLLYWVFGGVGVGLVVQSLLAFEVIRLPFHNLERKLAERKLGRKL